MITHTLAGFHLLGLGLGFYQRVLSRLSLYSGAVYYVEPPTKKTPPVPVSELSFVLSNIKWPQHLPLPVFPGRDSA